MSDVLLEHHLRTLRLPTMLANYRRLLGEHAEPLPYLADLVALESAKRQENGVKARIMSARFPTIKTMESFDFSLQPQLPKSLFSSISMVDLLTSIETSSLLVRPTLRHYAPPDELLVKSRLFDWHYRFAVAFGARELPRRRVLQRRCAIVLLELTTAHTEPVVPQQLSCALSAFSPMGGSTKDVLRPARGLATIGPRIRIVRR